MGAIQTGYYKWRNYWESKSFTKGGKNMKAHDKWKRLFLLSRSHTISVKAPHKLSSPFKNCRDNARELANT
tara:strand:+ start:146 stop:358 length:213 start_codon:yes stop_codon:yes gene_type:complete